MAVGCVDTAFLPAEPFLLAGGGTKICSGLNTRHSEAGPNASHTLFPDKTSGGITRRKKSRVVAVVDWLGKGAQNYGVKERMRVLVEKRRSETFRTAHVSFYLVHILLSLPAHLSFNLVHILLSLPAHVSFYLVHILLSLPAHVSFYLVHILLCLPLSPYFCSPLAGFFLTMTCSGSGQRSRCSPRAACSPPP